MQSSRSIEPPDSAGPGVIPGDHAHPRDSSDRASGPFAKLLGVVRGDKYMADAYEPAWSAAMERRTGHAAAGASPPQER
jgi:hypothetical protein